MSDKDFQIDRRTTLKLIATSATLPVIGCSSETKNTPTAGEVQQQVKNTVQNAPKKQSGKVGGPTDTLTDPDMHNPKVTWDMVLEKGELATLKDLADVIIPADDKSPSAGELGAQHYINEYVSAPYGWCKRDLITVRGGLVWLDGEAQRRFSMTFIELSAQQKTSILDDIKWEEGAKPQFKAGARFFAKVRDLTATAFYTTEEGMADIGFVGNTPLASFDGPPKEVLEKLGLA